MVRSYFTCQGIVITFALICLVRTFGYVLVKDIHLRMALVGFIITNIVFVDLFRIFITAVGGNADKSETNSASGPPGEDTRAEQPTEKETGDWWFADEMRQLNSILTSLSLSCLTFSVVMGAASTFVSAQEIQWMAQAFSVSNLICSVSLVLFMKARPVQT
ncbi:uncharacterized protein [Parasteatoda tepidariorum]|nr:uncharacterized protein LOC107447904 isoform X2 [Parasteatoda tepidariorum]XP_042908505.1 uncharacterized protein LOC107447904 isoform X2 [Parasteatoda tepidariorum]